MQIEIIHQIELGNISRLRVGDCLNRAISNPECRQFRFAVAYMRLSGWDRLAGAVDNLLNRRGKISGAVGIDEKITTIEALESLSKISRDSTVFHTTSSFIFHPKIYIICHEEIATVIMGSPNLTCGGLFRNIELATAIHLDFSSSIDLEVYKRYDLLINELLDTSHPNVQPINRTTILTLSRAGLIEPESQSKEPGSVLRSRGRRRSPQPTVDIERLFPPLKVPVAPPGYKKSFRRIKPPRAIISPSTADRARTLVLQLSAFDSSHRTGVMGTPEVLIPHPAMKFFPPLSLSDRRYPDVLFDAILNMPTGRERQRYRLWYYEMRATGSRIDEYRLRVLRDTIDLSTPGGGDLLVINKLPEGSDPPYEVTILPQTDPMFPVFFALCTQNAQGKKWGII